MLGGGLLGDCRNYKLEKKTPQITVFSEDMGRGFLGQGASENPKYSVAIEQWEGAYEKGSVELPRDVRSSRPSLDNFIGVGWMLLDSSDNHSEALWAATEKVVLPFALPPDTHFCVCLCQHKHSHGCTTLIKKKKHTTN